jgi:GNAT superfamily N-acetyltransferase
VSRHRAPDPRELIVTAERKHAAITGVPVTRLGAAELPDCIALGQDRGWSPDPDRWQLLFEAGEVFGIRDPAGGLAGSVALTLYGPAFAAIGNMLVAARHERRGLGGALMAHALTQAGGAVTCLFATSYGRPLYERLGFRPADRSVRFIGSFGPGPLEPVSLVSGPPGPGSLTPGPLTPGPLTPGPPGPGSLASGALVPGGPGGDGLAIRPVTAADEPAIAALDREVFGADRRAILARLPGLAERFLVALDPAGRAVRGFAASWGHDGLLLAGPVVAGDLAVATALLTALAAGAGRPLRIEVAGRHPGLAQWAAARGLTARSETTFMTHGGDFPGRPGQLFGPLHVAMG